MISYITNRGENQKFVIFDFQNKLKINYDVIKCFLYIGYFNMLERWVSTKNYGAKKNITNKKLSNNISNNIFKTSIKKRK